MSRVFRSRMGLVVVLLALMPFGNATAQDKFTIDQILSPAYPFDLVSAQSADRIAWIAYERGMRNVYTAVAPDFRPQRVTDVQADDGNDMSSLRISADGSMIVFVRGHAPNRDGWIANPLSNPDGAERAIWAVRSSGGRPWKVVVAANPILSPDGKRVMFVRDGQIHVVPVDPSERMATGNDGSQPLFKVYGRNSNPSWSPDSGKIAFSSNRGDHSYIGVYDLANPSISYMTPGVDHDTSPSWSHDGKQVAFVRRPGTPFGNQGTQGGRGGRGGRAGRGARAGRGREGGGPGIKGLTRAAFKGGYTLSFWVADVATGKGREFWHNQPDDRVLRGVRSIEWAGENVMFRLDRDNWRHYYSVPLAGGEAEPIDLTPGEGLAEYIGLSKDGRQLYYATNVGDIDRRHLWRTPTSGGESVQLTDDEIETIPVPLASGNTVAMLSAGAKRPLSVAVVPSSGGEPRVIFPVLSGDFPGDAQVVPENVMITAEDGFEFHNQLFVPKDIQPGERRPAVLFTHGGPQRQMLLGYHYRHFYHMAYGINQFLANQGYVVISVNYRSGIGYGSEFRNAPNRGTRGNSEYQDVLAAGKYLQSRPDVDPERIGLWGLSYGGILTAQGLARNSDIFAAGVDIAGVHLWGSAIDPESVSYQSSSISQIEKWTSPVLLIHGDDDRNVAFSQTTGLVQLLRAHDVYHELIVFPDDVHDSLLYNRWMITFDAMDDFFRRFLKEK